MYRFLTISAGMALLISSPAFAQTSSGTTIESRLFAYFDRDRDGTILGAEFDKIPIPMKIWLKEQGVDGSKPLSRDQFLKSAPAMMQAIRKGRHAGREKTPSRKVTVKIAQPQSAEIVSSGTAKSDSSSSNASDQVNPTLSASFSGGDLDKDGQIGLYEWRKWRKSALSGFLKLDRNSDGFLTPRELLNASMPSTGSVSSTTTPVASSTSTTSASTSSPTSASSSTTSTVAVAGSYDPNHPDAKTPLKYFAYMDLNKNGLIDGPTEWLKGKSVKMIAERSGVDLSKPMTKDQVVAAYIKGKAASQ